MNHWPSASHQLPASINQRCLLCGVVINLFGVCTFYKRSLSSVNSAQRLYMCALVSLWVRVCSSRLQILTVKAPECAPYVCDYANDSIWQIDLRSWSSMPRRLYVRQRTPPDIQPDTSIKVSVTFLSFHRHFKNWRNNRNTTAQTPISLSFLHSHETTGYFRKKNIYT